MSKTNCKLKEFVGATMGRPNFEEISKKEKGITLIALIITIVVMLILVAVTLDIAIGENGLISKARTAAAETQRAMDKEELLFMVMEAYDAKNDVVDIGKLSASVNAKGWSYNTTTNLVTNKDGIEIGYVDLNSGEITDVLGDSPVEQFSLDGTYYNDFGEIIKIDGNKIEDSNDATMEIAAIDNENQTITLIRQEPIRDANNNIIGYEPAYETVKYEVITQNGEAVNIFLYEMDEHGEKVILVWQNMNGFTTGELKGTYTSISQGERLIFEPSTYTVKSEYTSDQGQTWHTSSGSENQTYFYYDGVYYKSGSQLDYDVDTDTIYFGKDKVYTK